MKMKSVVIRTTDIQKSINFYEKIMDFTFDGMISAAMGKKIAFLTNSKSGGKLELMYNERGEVCSSGSVSLTFIVDQIRTAEEYLIKNKVTIVSSPKTIKEGKKIMTAVDPNGVELDFIEE